MSTREVATIIASLNGGYNGDVPGKQIGVSIDNDEGTQITYTLTTSIDEEDEQIERYIVTISPATDDDE